jgi:hypothetical protein
MPNTTAEKRQVFRLRSGAVEVCSARMWCRVSGSMTAWWSHVQGSVQRILKLSASNPSECKGLRGFV